MNLDHENILRFWTVDPLFSARLLPRVVRPEQPRRPWKHISKFFPVRHVMTNDKIVIWLAVHLARNMGALVWMVADYTSIGPSLRPCQL
jgi:hypothetical protein